MPHRKAWNAIHRSTVRDLEKIAYQSIEKNDQFEKPRSNEYTFRQL